MNKKLKGLLIKLNITKMKEWILEYGKKRTWKCIESMPDADARIRFRHYYRKALNSINKKKRRKK